MQLIRAAAAACAAWAACARAQALPGSCSEGTRNANIAPAAPAFAATGTVLVLQVGDGSQQPLVAGVAQPLRLLELDTGTGATRQSIALPAAGTTVGASLACTLAVGLFANATWDFRLDNGFSPDRCTEAENFDPAYFGALPPSQGGPACAAAPLPASSRYNASWNSDALGGGHGDGAYPLQYFDREGTLSLSYDGRFVSLPCYARPAGLPLQLGSWFAAAGGDASNPLCSQSDALDSMCYDSKTIAVVDAAGGVDTVTHLPGSDFFYGPLIPDEPQYMRSAVTTGESAPSWAFYMGGAADNGEGTMFVPDDALSPSKGANRITNTPGYFDYGSLSLYSAGAIPTASATGDAPLAFVTSPSMLNSGAQSLQHQQLRGLSVMTVGGVPRLSQDESAAFVPLAGFSAYVGHPFDVVWQSASSVWLADAGPGATGGPATCAMLGAGAPCPPPIERLWNATPGAKPAGLWDKYSCTLQHWTSDGGIFGNWSWAASVIVSSGAPCFSMAGRVEPAAGGLVLYVATSSLAAAEPSRVYRVAVADAPAVSTLAEAPAGTQFRALALPPQPRANYTCPAGSFGKSCDLACAYDCCAPCSSPVCPAGTHLVPACSFASDNLCVADSPSATPSRGAAPASRSRAPAPSATPAPPPPAAAGLSPAVSAVIAVGSLLAIAGAGAAAWVSCGGGRPAWARLAAAASGRGAADTAALISRGASSVRGIDAGRAMARAATLSAAAGKGGAASYGSA